VKSGELDYVIIYLYVEYSNESLGDFVGGSLFQSRAMLLRHALAVL
jgi:hypothetical protein